MARVNEGSRRLIPTTHTFINNWNEPFCPTPQQQDSSVAHEGHVPPPQSGRVMGIAEIRGEKKLAKR